MATVRYLFSFWIKVLLLLSSFHNGDCMGPNARRCNCGNTAFSGTSGTVTSPYYPNDYRNNCRCRYIITVTNPNRIRLQFHSLDFGDNTCQQDSIRVYDGQINFSALITWFCSNRNTPTTLTSQTQKLFIWFRSDSRTVAGGFRATYSIIPPTTDAPTTHITTLPTTPTTGSTTTTHITTLLTTPTTRSTTRMTTPLVTSSAKTTSVSTSTLAPTTTKVVTYHKTSSEGPLDISPTFTSPVTFQSINERISTGLANVSTKAELTLPINVGNAEAQSSLLRYVWILPLILVIVLIVCVASLLYYIKRKRSGKTSGLNGNRGTTDSIPPDVLAADGTTVIVNQTYQSNDDFIPDTVYQPVEDNVVNGTTVKTQRNNTGVVESKDDLESQNSPLYQTTNISESDSEVAAHNYDLLSGDKSLSGDVNQNPGDSAYQYADFDKSEYQYAESTSRYDYAEAATLPASAKYTAKANSPATYEALNPLNRESDASIHERSTVTENVAYATSDPIQSSRYMELEEVANKPYQGLLTTTGYGFVENSAYSGVETEEGYLYPDVSKMGGKGFSQETGYDQVDVGAYAAVGESSQDESNLNLSERSGTLPNSEAYDVVNVNSEGSSTIGQQQSQQYKNENDDVVNGETYETLNYRNASEVSLSYNETGYLDYKASGNASYQELKPNVNSLFGPRPHRR
ncbi:CUB and sushi domain-containing protein 1 [Holothuria leucospilota]|uniref:CUB and sushi domain-containing protein 1 n=1 Tax=Holothuria leucospilota TaxID=206669 RepID=A0A9Q1BVE3_HOLLE|nr:CUB and sushi domain-containing protein 1 [Holothuria leucospilota]